MLWKKKNILLLVVRLVGWCLFLSGCCREAQGEGYRRRYQGMEQARDVTIWNQSGRKVDVFWVNINTGRADASQTEGKGLAYGAAGHISSYIGHTFEIQELPNPRTFQCGSNNNKQGKNRPCRTARFTVSSNEDQEFTVWKNFTVTRQDNKSRALQKAKNTLEECLTLYSNKDSMDATTKEEEEEEDPILALTQCMDEKIQQALKETQEEVHFQASIRQTMGRELAHYACHDSNATTTPSTSNLTWTYYDPTTRKKTNFVMQTLFETAESGAWLVNDFISPTQCKTLQSYGQAVPASAESMPVIQLMLQIQKLVEAITSYSPKFGIDPERPMLNLWQRQSTTTAMTDKQICSISNSNTNECRAATNDDDNNGDDDDEMMEQHWIPENAWGTIILLCPPSSGGAIHFPRTGVHIAAQHSTGSIVWVTHGDHDPYMNEFLLCLPPPPATTSNTLTTLTLWMDHLI